MKIEGSIKVYLVWDDEANAWEPDDINFDGDPLDWASDPYIPDAALHGLSERDLAALQRAADRVVNAEDLAFMLGSGVTQQHMRNHAVVPANSSRPISRGLVEVVDSVIEGALNSHNAHISDETRATLRARLLPVFASVDENAFLRGKAAGR